MSCPQKKIEQAGRAGKAVQTAGEAAKRAFEETSAKEISELLAKHGDDLVVCLLVEAERFAGYGGPPVPYPNHWVRLLKPIEFRDDGAHGEMFTWGDAVGFHAPNNLGFRFQDVCFAMVVGARKPGLLAGVKAIQLPNLLS